MFWHLRPFRFLMDWPLGLAMNHLGFPVIRLCPDDGALSETDDAVPLIAIDQVV